MMMKMTIQLIALRKTSDDSLLESSVKSAAELNVHHELSGLCSISLQDGSYRYYDNTGGTFDTNNVDEQNVDEDVDEGGRRRNNIVFTIIKSYHSGRHKNSDKRNAWKL